MVKAYPSLSSKGWIEDPRGVIDAVMANFLITHPSLNVPFSAEILAFPMIIQQYGHSDTDMRRETQSAVETLLTRWFDSAIVEVTISYPFPDDETRYGLHIYASVESNGETFNVAREITLANGKVVEIVRINNG